MLRYTTDRPGLVIFYDIRPGNRAGLFLQPQNPHRAHHTKVGCCLSCHVGRSTVGPPKFLGCWGPHRVGMLGSIPWDSQHAWPHRNMLLPHVLPWWIWLLWVKLYRHR